MQNTNINGRIVDVRENKTYISDERLAGNSYFYFSGYIRLGFLVLTEVNSKMPFLECDGA
jgi:hypothetical protein